jgi:uncharacterized protein (DUF2141 family)
MKNVSIISSTATLILLSTSVQATQLEIDISGIKSDAGKIYMQLFRGEDNFKQNKPVVATFIEAKTGEAKVLFNDVEAGEYAVRFFHDENDNGKLETNLFRLPTEGYGFSNDATPNFGPVSYSQMKFIVPTNVNVVVNQTSVIY